jgi:hypothetical protein
MSRRIIYSVVLFIIFFYLTPIQGTVCLTSPRRNRHENLPSTHLALGKFALPTWYFWGLEITMSCKVPTSKEPCPVQ